MADIFIGYASEDRSRVKPLAEKLESHGWSVWWDWRSIPVGKTWRQAIEEGLEAAKSVLVLWSNKSISKDWVIEEADFGKERKNLVPVIIDDVRPPIGFRQIQGARLIDWKGEVSHTGYRHIIQALTLLLGSPAQHEAKELTESTAKELPKPAETFKNSIGMEFVLIPAGEFMMGNRLTVRELAKKYGGNEKDYICEQPRHRVAISKPFYLQTTAVTQGQWKAIMKDNPSKFKDCGEDCPVENVNWDDAQIFIKKLNEKEGADQNRLPTEAEWEYACRAGTTTEFSFGDHLKELTEYTWCSNNSDGKTHPVGQNKPNAWGLYDMHGNVWEWVEDDWHGNYQVAPDDGSAWIDDPRGVFRVFRGGSWGSDARRCRSAIRFFISPGIRDSGLGFRLARSVTLGP